MDFNRLIEGIKKTGFVLENEVCEILASNRWNVIGNRYYIDDSSNIEREIDIIAYKVKEIEETLYYTSLIISCKKSDNQIWTFLTRDIEKNDPNILLYPVFNWTNNKILDYMIGKVDYEEQIRNQIDSNKDLEIIYGIDKQIFAFQQMDNYNPKNDKDIYNSNGVVG